MALSAPDLAVGASRLLDPRYGVLRQDARTCDGPRPPGVTLRALAAGAVFLTLAVWQLVAHIGGGSGSAPAGADVQDTYNLYAITYDCLDWHHDGHILLSPADGYLDSTGQAESDGGFVIVSAQFGYKDKASKLPDLPENVTGFFFTEESSKKHVKAGSGWTVVTTPYHQQYLCQDVAGDAAEVIDLAIDSLDTDSVKSLRAHHAGRKGNAATCESVQSDNLSCDASELDDHDFAPGLMCCFCGGGAGNKTDAQGKYSLSTLSPSAMGLTGILSAKFYRMNAFRLPELQGAGAIMWMDSGKMWQLRDISEFSDMATVARKLLGGHDMVVQHHETRQAVKEELRPAAGRAANTQHVEVKEMVHQHDLAYEELERQGFKDDIGLFNTAEFIYNPRSAKAQKMLLDWWLFVQLYTFRDQISFPHFLVTNGVDYLTPCCGMGCLVPSLRKLARLAGP